MSLRANPDKVAAWQERSRQRARERGGMPDRSASKVAAAPDERAVREAVFARDRHTCCLADLVGVEIVPGIVVPRCRGLLTFHHRRKANATGAYVEANGATACLGHNGWIEDEPDAVREVRPDLVVREGDDEWFSLGKRANR